MKLRPLGRAVPRLALSTDHSRTERSPAQKFVQLCRLFLLIRYLDRTPPESR